MNKIKSSDGEYNLLIDVSNKDEKIYSIKKNSTTELSLLSASFFDDGELMLIDISEGVIELYNTSGELINRIVSLNKTKSQSDRVIKTTTTGLQSAVLLSDPGLTNSKLISINSEGKVELEKEIEGNHATGIEMLGDNKIIAAGTYTWIDTSYSEHTTFLSVSGKVLGKVSVSFSTGRFTEDGNGFLGFTNSNMFLANISESKVNWLYEFPSENNVIDAVISKKEIYVLSADLPVLKNNKWFYSNLVINTFSTNGKLIEKQEIKSDPIENAKIVLNGTEINVSIDGKITSVN